MIVLEKLELTRFGKFCGEEIALSAGFDPRFYPNEFGKSTMADFIVFCFYGFKKPKGKKALEENLPQKYLPWGQDTLAGAVEFTADGRRYRLERECDAKGKGTARLLDGSGTAMKIDEPGEQFFGVDSETFLNIFFMRGSRRAIYRTGQTEVAMKNLVTTGDEDVSFDSVLERLMKERGKYATEKRDAGALRNLKKEMQQRTDQIVALEQEIRRLQKQLPDENAQKEQLAALEAQQEQTEQAKAARKAHEAFLRQQKRAALRKTIEENSGETFISAQDYRILSEHFARIEHAQALYEQARQAQRAIKAPQALSAAETAALTTSPKHTAALFGGVVIALGAVATVLLRQMQPWNWGVGAVCVILGVVLLWLGCRMPAALRKAGITRRAAFQKAAADAREKQQAQQAAQQQFAAAQGDLEVKEQALIAAKEAAAPICQKTKVFDRTGLETAYQKQLEAEAIRQKAADAQEALAELAESEAQDEQIACRAEAPLMPMAEIEKQQKQLQEKKAVLYEQITQNAAQNSQLCDLQRRKSELTDIHQADQGRAQDMERALFIADAAIDALRRAQQQLQEDYAPLLRQKLSEKVALLTDGKYDQLSVDPELNVHIKADGAFRPLGYFSTGTADAVYLSLRFVLADIVQKDRAIPFIMDDPFLNFDPQRMARVKQMLQAEGAERQIIFFSCVPQEA